MPSEAAIGDLDQTDLTIGVLMSAGPEVVTDACVGVAGVRFIGMAGPDDLAPHIDKLDAIVVSNDFYTPEVARLIYAAPRLRWLQSSSTGYEHLSALGAPTHLAVTQPGSVYSDIVAEHAMALLLALARGVLQMERNRLEQLWDLPKVAATMVSLKDRNLLLIGFGGIGQETARRARPFGMTITAMVRRPPSAEAAKLADKLIYREQLHEALAEADAIVLGIPLIADTEKLIGAAEFAAMKPNALLINMARGPVVDEQALIAALRRGPDRRRRHRRGREGAAGRRQPLVGHGARDHLAAPFRLTATATAAAGSGDDLGKRSSGSWRGGSC